MYLLYCTGYYEKAEFFSQLYFLGVFNSESEAVAEKLEYESMDEKMKTEKLYHVKYVERK